MKLKILIVGICFAFLFTSCSKTEEIESVKEEPTITIENIDTRSFSDDAPGPIVEPCGTECFVEYTICYAAFGNCEEQDFWLFYFCTEEDGDQALGMGADGDGIMEFTATPTFQCQTVTLPKDVTIYSMKIGNGCSVAMTFTPVGCEDISTGGGLYSPPSTVVQLLNINDPGYKKYNAFNLDHCHDCFDWGDY